jgi:hypothetical protein
MNTEMGEYLVGAYLRLIKKCDVVDYNVRPPGGKLQGLNELDVVGLDFKKKLAYVCEVTTHIRGARPTVVGRMRRKSRHQREYARKYLQGFSPKFMFWSPIVPRGIESELKKLRGLELVVNCEFAQCVKELEERAKKWTHDTNNPVFRTLQILARLRR